jgi:hypothetical protein
MGDSMTADLRAAIDEVREFANMDDKHERWRNVLLAVCAAAERAGEPVDIAAAVNRFLQWELPRTFGPDCGISFDGRKPDQWNPVRQWPVGTNLFTADEARAMFEHCLARPPLAAPVECAVCGAPITARCDSALCPQSSTALTGAQQEQHDDNDSTSADRGQQGVRSVSVERAGQATGGADDIEAGGVRGPDNPRGAERDRAGDGRLPLLIDNDTLRKQIAADPDDEPSAGSLAAPPASEPQAEPQPEAIPIAPVEVVRQALKELLESISECRMDQVTARFAKASVMARAVVDRYKDAT